MAAETSSLIVSISIGSAPFQAACEASLLGSTLLTDMVEQCRVAVPVDEDVLIDFVRALWQAARAGGLVDGVVGNDERLIAGVVSRR